MDAVRTSPAIATSLSKSFSALIIVTLDATSVSITTREFTFYFIPPAGGRDPTDEGLSHTV